MGIGPRRKPAAVWWPRRAGWTATETDAEPACLVVGHACLVAGLGGALAFDGLALRVTGRAGPMRPTSTPPCRPVGASLLDRCAGARGAVVHSLGSRAVVA